MGACRKFMQNNKRQQSEGQAKKKVKKRRTFKLLVENFVYKIQGF